MYVVKLSNVHKTFGSKKVLNDISFEIKENEKVCIIGPNGSGKTTLLRVILGLVKPDNGAINVFSRDPRDIGYLPQIPLQYPYHKVFDVIYYSLRFAGFSSLKAKEKAIEWIKRVGLDSDSVGLNLSGGERKLVLLAMAMAKDPKLLILDEPTNMIDIHNYSLSITSILFTSSVGIYIGAYFKEPFKANSIGTLIYLTLVMLAPMYLTSREIIWQIIPLSVLNLRNLIIIPYVL
jgi:ABC-type multidrug transport system ATPase subunit